MMKLRTLLVFLLFFSFIYAEAQIPKDTIFFRNGSMVIGKLKKAKLGVVTFDPDDANDITVQLRVVKTLSAPSKIFRVETIDNQIHFGTISPTSEMRKIYLWTPIDSAVIDLINVSVLYPYGDNFFKRLSGFVGLGFNYTRSSGFGRLNYDNEIRYTARKIELTVAASGIYSIYDTAFSRDKEDVYIKNNYFFTNSWFVTGFVAYQRNIALAIEQRFQEGLGIGNKFITTKTIYTWARGGLVFNQERSTENVNSGTLTELFGEMELNLYRFEVPKIKTTVANTAYYSLSQKDRIRDDFSLNMSWELVKNFFLTMELYANYDSKPPANGSREFDYGTVVGLRYDLKNP